MNKALYTRIGAILAMLTVLVGGLAALPSWTAAAQDHIVFGFVQECGANPPKFLATVAVSLVDAQGIRGPEGQTTLGDGYYEFSPSPGTFLLRFTRDGYYSREIGAFRFDGSRDLPAVNVCLTKMPDRDASLQVLVVDDANLLHPNETVAFARTQVPVEDAGPRFDSNGNFTRTKFSPVWTTDYEVRYRGTFLNPSVDYTWSNFFDGTLQILNPTVAASLASTHQFLNVTYWYASTTSRLSSYPVIPGSAIVFKDGVLWGVSGQNWTLDESTGGVRILNDFLFGTNTLTVTYRSAGALADATVNLLDQGQNQVVSTSATNGTGFATFPIWRGVLEVQVSKDEYHPVTLLVDTATTNFTRVVLTRGIIIVGHAFRSDNFRRIDQGVVGFLYNVDRTWPAFRKVIEAQVVASLYTFYAEPGQTYRMVVDANGYKAATRTITTPLNPPYAGNPVDSFLAVSEKEVYRSTVSYAETNWSRMAVSRNLTLRSDSTLPALKLAEIRSLDLQIDYHFGLPNGTANGVRDAGENASFVAWLGTRSPYYVTTNDFLTTNGAIHNWSVPPPTWSVNYFAEGGRAIWINRSASYRLRATTPLANSAPTYFVNVTTPNDVNESVYQDQVIVVDFPRGYEMTDKKVTGTITTSLWTVVTLDPGLSASGATSEIEMTVRKSINGTARAAVAGPIGKFHVLSDTDKNYTAIVAEDTNITFSAEQSIDPVGNIRDANFTWHFTNNTNRARIGYNITSTFNYTAAILAAEGHEFTVNLTVVEAGGNRTYRDIKIFVDDTPPVARLRTNRTVGDWTGKNLQVDEDSPIKFYGDSSSDVAWSTAPPWLNNHTASIPSYQTKPTPNFVILDPSRDWIVTTSLVEGKNYSFNASSSSDNYDSNRNLSYTWHFPGPVNCTPACDSKGNISSQKGYNAITSTWGWNVTVWWREFNVSYNVTVNVTDTGFLGRPPNYANLTSGIAVAVDLAKHPDLKYIAASLKIEPGQPEEGQLINVSFMIENGANRANATDVHVVLEAKDPNGVNVLNNTSPQWLDVNWNPITDRRVNTGARVRLIFLISFPAQGNKSLEIKVYDGKEPYTWVDSQNRITGSVFVKLAGWVIPLAIILFIALVIGVAFAARTYSRYRSGELVFRRKEKKEKKEKKKLEDKDEAAEPEEDNKGKKRL